MTLRSFILASACVSIAPPVHALDLDGFIDLVIADAATLGLEADNRPKTSLAGENLVVSEWALFEPLPAYLSDFASTLPGFEACPHSTCVDLAGGAFVEGLREDGNGYRVKQVSARDVSILSFGMELHTGGLSLAPAYLGSPADGTNGLFSASPMLDFALYYAEHREHLPAYPSTFEIDDLTLAFDGDTLARIDSIVQETTIDADQGRLNDEIVVTGIVVDQSSQTEALANQPYWLTNALRALRNGFASQTWNADGSGDAMLELDFGEHGAVTIAVADYVLPFEAFLSYFGMEGYPAPRSYFPGSSVRSVTIGIDPGIFELAGEDRPMFEPLLAELAATASDTDRRVADTEAVERFIAGHDRLEIALALDRPLDVDKLIEKLSHGPMRLLGNLREAITITAHAL